MNRRRSSIFNSKRQVQSHTCHFTFRDLARIFCPTLGFVAAFVLVLTAASKLGIWTHPITADTDAVVLAHQSRACRSGPLARVVLVGDSTCLVGVDARELSRRLPGQPRVLSLALFMWLGLDVYGEEVAEFASTHPNEPQAVVLLVTPVKLASACPPGSSRPWDEIHHGPRQDNNSKRNNFLGAQMLREDLFSRVLAAPLHGSGAGFYGFVPEIERYMTEHDGSIVSPGNLAPRRPSPGLDAPYKLAPELELETRAFRAGLPSGTKLLIGLTPHPMVCDRAIERQRSIDLLQRWNRWMGADVVLTNLPVVLPDGCFGPGNHLNEIGQKKFTATLAHELARWLPGIEPSAARGF